MNLRLTSIARLALAGILSLVALGVLAGSKELREGFSNLMRAGGINTVDGARRSLVYRLDVERPTQFTFSGERDLVRLLSSVSIRQEALIVPNGWTYGYRIHFLDGAGVMLSQQDIYSQAILPEMTEQPVPHRFLRTSDERIAIQNETIVAAPDGTAAIQLMALEADRGVVGMDMRVYERQPLTDSGALVAFRRRSPEEQARLSSGSAFPANTLEVSEMRAVSRNSWRPVGPNGIAGESYQVVVMYEVDVEDEEVEVVAAP